MQRLTTVFRTPRGFAAMAATLLLGALAAYAADPDPALAGWIGREITITSSSFNDHVPRGGKLTFVLDAEDNVVRICTRNVTGQQGAWRMDLVPGCNVALTFTRGTRYCTVEDVMAGNAEVLSTCHRLRSHDVAMHPAAAKGALELHDVIVFLVEGAGGKHAISILVDSPSRVTAGGFAGGSD
jgi:hypothetical protein